MSINLKVKYYSLHIENFKKFVKDYPSERKQDLTSLFFHIAFQQQNGEEKAALLIAAGVNPDEHFKQTIGQEKMERIEQLLKKMKVPLKK